MKFSKAKSLFIILSLLTFASCQKTSISKSGYFTSLKKGRSIASISKEASDPKQILMYCLATNSNEKECYEKNSEKNESHTFFKAKKELKELTTNYLKSISAKIENKFDQRIKFCKKNSLYNFKRCLSMTYKKNTMEILNAEHKVKKFNAQEYLYLKKQIGKSLNKKITSYNLTRLTK